MKKMFFCVNIIEKKVFKEKVQHITEQEENLYPNAFL